MIDHLQNAGRQGFDTTCTKQWNGGGGDFGITNSVLHGPHGALGLESTWQIMEDGSRRLSTVIFRGQWSQRKYF